MCCNRFVGEMLVHTLWILDNMLLLQLLLCTKNKFLASSTLMCLLMKAGLSLNDSGREPPSLFHV